MARPRLGHEKFKDFQTTIRITQVTADYYLEAYGTRTSGITIAADAWPHVRRACLKELMGVFTDREIYYLIDCTSAKEIPESVMIDHNFLINEIQSAETFRRISVIYGAKPDRIIEKVRTLHPATLFFLNDEIRRVMRGNADVNDLLKLLV